MDLSEFIPESDVVVVKLVYRKKGEVFPILNDDGSDQTITLWAQHTKQYKVAKNSIIQKALKKAASEGKEDLDLDFTEIFPDVTKEWNITLEGKKPKFTVEKAREVYNKVPLIVPQIDRALSQTEDFT